MTRAWSTIRKVASEAGFAARQTECDGRPCYVLLNATTNNVVLCTRKGSELEAAVYGL